MTLATNAAPELDEEVTKYSVNKGINELNKKCTSTKSSGITLINNGLKDIMKVIKSLESRRNLLKGATRKINLQKTAFLNFLRPIMPAGLLLMKSVLTPLAKSVLLPFGLKAAMSATDAAILKNIYGSFATVLIISNEETKDIMKIVKSFEDSELIIEGISETIKNKSKEQKGGFLRMLLATLACSLLRSGLTGREVTRAGEANS